MEESIEQLKFAASESIKCAQSILGECASMQDVEELSCKILGTITASTKVRNLDMFHENEVKNYLLYKFGEVFVDREEFSIQLNAKFGDPTYKNTEQLFNSNLSVCFNGKDNSIKTVLKMCNSSVLMGIGNEHINNEIVLNLTRSECFKIMYTYLREQSYAEYKIKDLGNSFEKELNEKIEALKKIGWTV